MVCLLAYSDYAARHNKPKTVRMSEQAATSRTVPIAGSVETATGKGAEDENFPVAAALIAPRLRPHVMAFYNFARAADDIADNPDLAPSDKIARLDLFEAGLDGEQGVEKAEALRQSLSETGVPDRHARDLLVAFRQDAVKSRYATWAELIGYCEVSANPVGRYLMDLHGEDRGLWPASDALCTVLQILNHLQDCQKDYREMDRVYLPTEWFSDQGLDSTALDHPVTSDGLRGVLDRVLEACMPLVAEARTRPVKPRSLRLHGQTAMITALADRLAARLRRDDPLAMRVKLSKWDFAVAAVTGLRALVTPRRG